jgi:hypothetical protein
MSEHNLIVPNASKGGRGAPKVTPQEILFIALILSTLPALFSVKSELSKGRESAACGRGVFFLYKI